MRKKVASLLAESLPGPERSRFTSFVPMSPPASNDDNLHCLLPLAQEARDAPADLTARSRLMSGRRLPERRRLRRPATKDRQGRRRIVSVDELSWVLGAESRRETVSTLASLGVPGQTEARQHVERGGPSALRPAGEDLLHQVDGGVARSASIVRTGAPRVTCAMK